MASFLDKWKIDGSKLETPFTIRHVESHLIYGPLSRHFSVAYLVALFGAVKVANDWFNTAPIAQRVGGAIEDFFIWVCLMPLILSRMTRRQQAIIAWGVTKSVLGFVALMMATVGSLVSFQRHQSDAWPNLFLGLIWIPSIEFLPSVTPHQKYVTIARLLLTIPCVYFGVRSGSWHWS